MKNKTLISLCGAVTIGIATLVGTLNKPNPAFKDRVVCEYLFKSNGKCDQYRLLKLSKSKKEYLNLGIPYNIRFASPLNGSCLEGEFDKETLKVMFNKYHFPEVGEIRFVESKSSHY